MEFHMTGSPTSLAVSCPSQPWRLSRQSSLWLHALILLTFMAASSAPTPLYSLHRESWGFSATTLTVLLRVYSISLLLAFLVLGPLSDHFGLPPYLEGALLPTVFSLVRTSCRDHWCYFI